MVEYRYAELGAAKSCVKQTSFSRLLAHSAQFDMTLSLTEAVYRLPGFLACALT